MKTTYSQKTIQNLKPEWYIVLGTKEKLKIQSDLVEDRKRMLENKPSPLLSNMILAKETNNSTTKGNTYKVLNHFCTLVCTIYNCEWHQFVTLKNKYGHIVKMNLRKFDVVREIKPERKFEILT